MANELNWNLLNTAPVGENAFAHFQAGKEDRRKSDVRNAFARYGSDPEGASQALMAAGEYEGALKLQDRTAAQATQARRETAYQTAVGGDIKAARAQGGADLDLQSALDKMEDSQIKAADIKNSKLGAFLYNMEQNVPEDQWPAYVQRQAAVMELSPEQLAKMDLSRAGIKGYISQAMTLKEQIDASIKNRTLDQGDARIAETGRHNRAAEGVSSGRLGLARSNAARRSSGGPAKPPAGFILD